MKPLSKGTNTHTRFPTDFSGWPGIESEVLPKCSFFVKEPEKRLVGMNLQDKSRGADYTQKHGTTYRVARPLPAITVTKKKWRGGSGLATPD